MLGLHKLQLRTFPTGHEIKMFASAKNWPWLRPWL